MLTRYAIDKHILSAPLSIRDLAHVDQRLAKSAQDIMECDDVEALYLDFTTAVWMLGVTDIVELKENGANISVTNDNREVSFLFKSIAKIYELFQSPNIQSI